MKGENVCDGRAGSGARLRIQGIFHLLRLEQAHYGPGLPHTNTMIISTIVTTTRKGDFMLGIILNVVSKNEGCGQVGCNLLIGGYLLDVLRHPPW